MFLARLIKTSPILAKNLVPPVLSNRVHNICDGKEYDLVVVGAGIVGCAAAREILLRHPELNLAILEKERRVAYHQSGHNSGVIHAGIYYKPGSLKAKLCVEGLHLIYAYCDAKNIPYKKVGKLIVATDQWEVKNLMDLYYRGLQNKVPDIKIIEGSKIPEIEPCCQGVKAIWSPHTGIVDWDLVTQHYAQDVFDTGGDLLLNFEVEKFAETPRNLSYPVQIFSKDGRHVKTRYVLTCAGLQSDIMAELTGCRRDPRIVPIRGEYLVLKPDKCHQVKGNIYPVPDPRFPFLGVHFTPRMDGSVWLGPNALLAFKREGYKWSDFNAKEFLDALRYPGFLKLAFKFSGYGMDQMWKSLNMSKQVKELQKFIPDITVEDVERGPAGVRAQALSLDGKLVDDFIFDHGKGLSTLSRCVLHCRNAPSPGATSSLAIAKMIGDKIDTVFRLDKIC